MKSLLLALVALLPLSTLALTQEEAAVLVEKSWQDIKEQKLEESKAALKSKELTFKDKKLRLKTKTYGKAPKDGHSLFISMHGGGGTVARTNDNQWDSQSRLYKPKEGIYVAPRAPTNNWNLWHESHIDDLFDQLIDHHVIVNGVNPNKVYLMGYSAGGDGVYQLAPRMADRFAAAAMMAGHPNDASPLGLRNLPFAIYMGGKDARYQRNKIAAQWGEKLDALQKADPEGYTHHVKIYPQYGHWMEREDAEAVPWMANFTRKPWPRKVIWVQNGGHLHSRFYWLAIDSKTAKKGEKITATVIDNTIAITTNNPKRKSITVNLHDKLVDLEKPVTIKVNDQIVFNEKTERSVKVIEEFLKASSDPKACPTSAITVTW